jgi:hypothetical protein
LVSWKRVGKTFVVIWTPDCLKKTTDFQINFDALINWRRESPLLIFTLKHLYEGNNFFHIPYALLGKLDFSIKDSHVNPPLGKKIFIWLTTVHKVTFSYLVQRIFSHMNKWCQWLSDLNHLGLLQLVPLKEPIKIYCSKLYKDAFPLGEICCENKHLTPKCFVRY